MNGGSIYLATGPMFSGKTEWLINNLNQHKDTHLAIRYLLDNRYSQNMLQAHNGAKISAENASSVNDIIILSNKRDFDVIGIDEIQFFDIGLEETLLDLKSKGKKIFVSGLDLDFMRNKWETTEKVKDIADEVMFFKATCSICKKDNAVYSKRINDNENRIMIGGKDIYEARCEEHFEFSYS